MRIMEYKAYLHLFKIKFLSLLQYRVSAITGALTQIFFGFVFIMLYVSFYDSNASTTNLISLQTLVNYLWLNQSLFVLVYIWDRDDDLLSMIKNGDIAYEILRPINFYLKWFFTMYAKRIAGALMRLIPVLLVAFLFPYPYGMTLPTNFSSFITFLVLIFLSSIIVTSISMLFHLIVFFTFDEKGILSFLMVIGEIFSGGSIPIAFFPSFLKQISSILPFRFVCDVPFIAYSNAVDNPLNYIILAILWAIILIFVGYILSKIAIKRAIIQGG